MHLPLDFTNEETYKLYIAYHEYPESYAFIKRKAVGKGVQSYRNAELGGRLRATGLITFITLAGSAFAVFAGDRENMWTTIGALWLIWLILNTAFLGSYFLGANRQLGILKENEAFFQRFEACAKQAKTLDDFKIDWNTPHRKVQASDEADSAKT